MKRRTFEEMVIYFNQTVADMDIPRKYKMELLGMITAILQKHDEEVRCWIPVTERLPEYDGEMYLVTDYCEQINRRRIHISYCYVNREGFWSDVPIGYKVIAWMPLPAPYTEETNAQNN